MMPSCGGGIDYASSLRCSFLGLLRRTLAKQNSVGDMETVAQGFGTVLLHEEGKKARKVDERSDARNVGIAGHRELAISFKGFLRIHARPNTRAKS